MDHLTRNDSLAEDLLIGAQTIGHFLGLTAPQVFHLHRKRALPTFKMGALVCARKSELRSQLSAAGQASA